MFLNKKNETPTRIKARLVAGGNQQDKTLYEDVSSPTAATASIMAIAAIAAKEGRHVRTMDVGGAFLNAKMDTGVTVHVRLSGYVAALILKKYPKYLPYANKKGELVVRLNRAMYGCIEAGLCWFRDIKGELERNGYTHNPYDPCVFNKGVSPNQATVGLHVDDLKCTAARDSDLDELETALTKRYGRLTVHKERIHNYLGMRMDYTVDGQVKITMQMYVESILEECGVEGVAKTC